MMLLPYAEQDTGKFGGKGIGSNTGRDQCPCRVLLTSWQSRPSPRGLLSFICCFMS
jgi:hypothetical protein